MVICWWQQKVSHSLGKIVKCALIYFWIWGLFKNGMVNRGLVRVTVRVLRVKMAFQCSNVLTYFAKTVTNVFGSSAENAKKWAIFDNLMTIANSGTKYDN